VLFQGTAETCFSCAAAVVVATLMGWMIPFTFHFIAQQRGFYNLLLCS
jgi:hypothetical protein